MIRGLVVAVVTGMTVLICCSAGMLTTFGGQKMPPDQAAKLFLKERVGRRNGDSVMYCFVIEIDGVNLAENSGIYDLRTDDQFGRIAANYDIATKLKSLALEPGNHEVAFQFTGRRDVEGPQTISSVLTPRKLSFDAESGHAYVPKFTCQGTVYHVWLEDKRTGETVAADSSAYSAGG